MGNLYKFKGNSSLDTEIHYLLPIGRITLKAWTLRLAVGFFLFCIYVFTIWVSVYYLKSIGESIISIHSFFSYFGTKFIFWLFPFLIFVFITIQSIKRLHDVNKGGKLLFVPFYNISLLISPGSTGENNDFGINPLKGIEFFSDLEKVTKTKKGLVVPEHIKIDNRLIALIVIIFFAPLWVQIFKQADKKNPSLAKTTKAIETPFLEEDVTKPEAIVEPNESTGSRTEEESEESTPPASTPSTYIPKVLVKEPRTEVVKTFNSKYSPELIKLVEQAKDGNVNAMFEAGEAFYSGRMGKVDYEEARQWFTLLALYHNNTEAQFYLGRMYEHGQGVTQDYQEALSWYKKAAAKEHSVSKYRIQHIVKVLAEKNN